MEKVKIAILGFGQRGFVYANIIKQTPKLLELAAVCEINSSKKELIQNMFSVKEENYYTNYQEMFAKGKIADILIISTMDQDHYQEAMAALDIGYDILLEKPVATTKKEIIAIKDKANKLGRKIAVAHVLRYTLLYQKLRELIVDGKIGLVQAISQTENIGYFHFAHSYVRGNWRKKSTSSPMILAKACHDLDIISFLIGSKCIKLSSFGNLNYFKLENAPKESSEHCYKCMVKCPYNALDFYRANPMWALIFSLNPNIEEVMQDENLTYARCVYKMDNDVADNQVVNLQYANGAIASLIVTAFSKETHRQIKIHGSLGEIEADLELKQIHLKPYLGKDELIDLSKESSDFTYHQGGDPKMLIEFSKNISEKKAISPLSDINNSIESHIMALDAEESRLNNGKVFIYN